jgi:hypothetical protein
VTWRGHVALLSAGLFGTLFLLTIDVWKALAPH